MTTASATAPTSSVKFAGHKHKVRPVPVALMRTPLHTQRKYLRAQAEELAAHFDPDKLGVPLMNHRDAVYWIVDGQHRIGALKIWFGKSDPGTLDCIVFENLTDPEAAEIFLGIDQRRPISTFEKFFIACTAERLRECDIRRTVESQDLKVSQRKESKCIACVSALNTVYDKAGAVTLGQVLRTLRDAYDGDCAAFDKEVIVGLGLTVNRYNGKINEKHLVANLANLPHGVRGILQKAEDGRARTGNQKIQCVAAALVDVYNKGLKGTQKLPSWWKLMDKDCKAR